MWYIGNEVIFVTIQQCRYVLEIVKQGSFNEAAKAMFVAQTSISGAVKSLEDELGIKIFERSNKGVFITDDGAELVHYAKQLVSNADYISERYSEPSKIEKLSISSQHYDFVAEVFGQFLSENIKSDFDFSIREVETVNVIDDVEKSFSDVGIIAIKDTDMAVMERLLDGKRILFEALFKTPFHVYIGKNHPLAENSTITFSQLSEYPYITYEQAGHNSSMFTEEFSDKIKSSKNVRITDRATLMNMLFITECYTIGTGTMNYSKLSGGNILSVPLDTSGEYIIGYIVRRDKNISSLARKFINELAEFFKTNLS